MRKTIALTGGILGMGVVDSTITGAGFTTPGTAGVVGHTPTLMGLGMLGVAGDYNDNYKKPKKKVKK